MDVSIVHPWDPWEQGIGGFESCLDSILRYAPQTWRFEMIGLTRDSRARPVGQRLTISFAGRPVDFFAALRDDEPDRVRPLPLSLRFVLACRSRGARTRGNIVQVHRFESALGPHLRAAARQVYFIHNHPEEIGSRYSDVRWHLLRGLHDRLLIRQLRRASAVVSVDPRTPAWVAERVPRSPANLIYQNQWADPLIFNGSDSEGRARQRLDLRSRLGAPPEAKVALFAGRLERQKDPMLLLESFALVYARDPDIWLAVVGKGRLEGTMKSKAQQLEVTRRTRFLGAVPREEMPNLYHAADALVCTSGFEAGPRTVFEALACGTPVVSVDVGQVRDVLGEQSDVGRLVLRRDAESVAEALNEVLTWEPSPALQKRCESSVAGFTPQRGLAPVFDLYESWIEEHRSTAPAD